MILIVINIKQFKTYLKFSYMKHTSVYGNENCNKTSNLLGTCNIVKLSLIKSLKKNFMFVAIIKIFYLNSNI